MVRINSKKQFVCVGDAFNDVDECKLQEELIDVFCTIHVPINFLICEPFFFFFLVGKDRYVEISNRQMYIRVHRMYIRCTKWKTLKRYYTKNILIHNKTLPTLQNQTKALSLHTDLLTQPQGFQTNKSLSFDHSIPIIKRSLMTCRQTVQKIQISFSSLQRSHGNLK